MKLNPKLAAAVTIAVRRAVGDPDDIADPTASWQRVIRRNDERADVNRREAIEAASRLSILDAERHDGAVR